MKPYDSFKGGWIGDWGQLRVWRWWMGIMVTLLLCLGAIRQPSAAAQLDEPTVAVILELKDAPLAAIYAAARQQAISAAAVAQRTQAQLETIEAAQQNLLMFLPAVPAHVLYRNQRVYNGIAVRAPAAQVAELAALPGVSAVHPLVAKRPSTTRSVPSIGAPVFWQGVAGQAFAGAGMTIALIDTGIDYLHTDFGGPGGGYMANDNTQIGDVVGFPSAKIIGGYDFTGDDYNADPDGGAYNPILAPDPDPMDCYPHGTSVAGAAAGYGVNSDGSTYTGAYGLATPTTALRIGPGVAPLAQLYALKVFGCAGSSEVVDQAIEWAVDPNGDGDLADQVDVINLSLGSLYGTTADMTAVAAENAALAGVAVVAAAGNSGDITYVIGSPAVASHVIGVAAGQFLEDGETGQYNAVPSFSSRGPRRFDAALKPDLTAPGYTIVSAGQGSGNGAHTSSGTSLATPHVAGALALLRALHPDQSPLELKALVMNTAATQLRVNAALTSLVYPPMRVGAGRLDLTRAISATALVFNADDPGLVSISFGAPAVVEHDQLTKAVRLVNLQPQPAAWALTYDPITDAPGVTITLPVTTVQVAAHSQTTATVWMEAEAAALTRQRDPTLSDRQASEVRHWLSEESGYLLFWPLTGPFTTTLTTTAALAASGRVVWSYAPVTRQLSYTIDLSALAAPVTSVSIERGAESMVALPLPSPPPTQGLLISGTAELTLADARWLSEGLLSVVVKTATEPTGALRSPIELPIPVLKLPVYAAPRPASTLQAAPVRLDFGAAAQATQPLTLTGVTLAGSQPPTGVVSLVSAVELQLSSPRLPLRAGDPAAFGFADLQFVGLAQDGPATPTQRKLYFAVASYEEWSTPNEVTFEIFIDIDQDGFDDYVLFNSDQVHYLSTHGTSDVFISALKELRTGGLTPQEPLNNLPPAQFDTAPYNSRVMILPVRSSALGLTSTHSTIRYRVESYSEDRPRAVDGERQLIDQTPTLVYDVRTPGLTISGVEGTPFVIDRSGTRLLVAFQRAVYTANRSHGLLLVYHHNESRLRTQVATIEYQWPEALYFPVVGRR